MRKKSTSTASRGKPKLGDKIRNIADKLKQETEVQKKATSRILGAAAQISQNHERLIDEVVDMISSDLDKQTQVYQKDIYTVEVLKQKFKTLREAKDYFNVKAPSWESLVNKLNELSPQKVISESKPQLHQVLNNNQLDELTVHLEPDVAKMFPNSQAVNEALRFLIRVTSKNK